MLKRRIVSVLVILTIISSFFVFTMTSQAAASESMFASKTGTAYTDSVAYELGTIFRSSVTGNIKGVKVYAVTGETGNHTIRIWNNSTNTVVAGPFTWSYTGANAWITYTLATPLSILANTDYTVVVSTGTDAARYYACRSGDLASAGNNGGSLSWPANAGVFTSGMGTRPASTYGGNNYLRDVVFEATGGNLALNKTVTYSSQETGNEASRAVDGDVASTRWSGIAATYPQWMQVDLGGTYSINQTKLYPYLSRAYQYKVEVSTDGSTFTMAKDNTSNITGGSCLVDSFTPVNARYVRLTVTGAASSYTGGWTSINEFEVYSSTSTPTPTPTPMSTPTPTPTSTPTPTPGGAWPDASNTGVPAGTILTPDTNPNITVNGTIYENKNVTGSIYVNANNVTIRKCKISADGYYGIRNLGVGLTIEDCEITATATFYDGIAGDNMTVRRCNIYNFENGLGIGSNVTVEDCYIHDLHYASGFHVDGIEWGSTGNNCVINHNNIILGGDTGCVNITPYGGGTAYNNTVTNNRFSGGTYSLYIRGDGGGTVSGVTVTNNVWVKNSYVYGTHSIVSASNITWSNNKLDDGTVIGQ